MKVCCACKVEKPLEAYYVRKAGNPQAQCKECCNDWGRRKERMLRLVVNNEEVDYVDMGGATTAQIAAALGVTPTRVLQIEATALRKLRMRAQRFFPDRKMG